MKTELQSNILSANTVKKVMLPCTIHALVQSMTFMVDTIVAGHYLGSDAVAAVALGMPIIALMISFVGMILQGGFLKLLGPMGRSDMKDYQRLFSLSLTFVFLVDFVFLCICFFGTNAVLNIAGAARASAEAVCMGRLYIRTACLMILFFSLASQLQIVMATYGYQTDIMLCSVICVVVNAVTSILFINVLPEPVRIASLGVGSAMATLVQMIAAWLLTRHRGIRLKYGLYPVNKRNIVDSLDMLRRGMPSSIDNMLDSASSSVVNRIILSSFADGTGVLALVAIIKTLWNIIRTIGRGAYFASEPLVGILHGGRDNEGIKKTFLTALRVGIIYAVGMAVLLMILKNPLLNFYHVAGNADAHTGVILLSIAGLLPVFSFVFNAVYESTGRLMLSLFVAVIPDSILYPLLLPVMSRAFGVTGVWLALGFNFIPFFIVFYLAFVIANKGRFETGEKVPFLNTFCKPSDRSCKPFSFKFDFCFDNSYNQENIII